MNGTLELCGMKFHSYHGCLSFEREKGADYLVDFKCSYDISAAASSDNLSDTVDFARIHALVAAQMSKPCKLIETVAAGIADSISGEFPELKHFSIKVSKLNPPVEGECLLSAVTIEI